mmetsp:Transcript_2209/g.4363  ORF Transcript_2209/g.4363 Transcript_2209/m.4363 type:complete len:357 (+) Transcript_2209:349-1419(+)
MHMPGLPTSSPVGIIIIVVIFSKLVPVTHGLPQLPHGNIGRHTTIIIVLVEFSSEGCHIDSSGHDFPRDGKLPSISKDGGGSRPSRPRRPSHPSDVLGRIFGKIKDHHVVHVGSPEIHPPRRPIRAHQHAIFSRLGLREPPQIFVPSLRRQGPVIGPDVEKRSPAVFPSEKVLNVAAAFDGVAEDEGPFAAGAAEGFEEFFGLLGLARSGIAVVGNGDVHQAFGELGGHFVQSRSFDHLGRGELCGDGVLHPPGEGGGDEEELGGGGGGATDVPEAVGERVVGHEDVGLVQNEGAQAAHVHRSRAQEGRRSPRRGHQDVRGISFEIGDLLAHRGAHQGVLPVPPGRRRGSRFLLVL